MQRFGGELEPSILAVDTAEPRLGFAAKAGLQDASPVIGQSIKVRGMDCNGPTPTRQPAPVGAGVLEPPPVEVLRRAPVFANHTSAGIVSMTARIWRSEMLEWSGWTVHMARQIMPPPGCRGDLTDQVARREP